MADGTLIFDTKVDTSGIKKGTNECDSAFSKTGGKAAAFGKAVAAGAAVAGAAVVALGKKSLDLYADYEQLVGGVETLFKDSSDIVMNYANQAYKTAGLSANEYMETITGFSASLLQSLGGDTKKAAEYGNQAVIDMSDNANKMGTDIARIQDAYQGFAKQNFTMLDNLKLGYGGTRGEMERLLEDANRINAEHGKMTDYSIDSFADITEAIHVVQTEMGITGTTSKEAATTIQGSLKMVQGAWTNLLTGLGDENADIDQLLNNLIDSITTAAKNIMPRITLIITGMVKAIKQLAPEIPKILKDMLPELITGVQGLIEGLVAVLPDLLQVIMDVIPMLFEALAEMAPMLIEAAAQLILIFCENLETLLPMVINTIIKALPQIIVALVKAIPTLVRALVSALIALCNMFMEPGKMFMRWLWNGIKSKTATVATNVSTFAKSLPGKIKAGIGSLVSIAANWIAGMANTVKAKMSSLASSVVGWAKKIPQKIKNGLGSLASVGKNFIAGLWNGIKAKFDSVVGKVKALAAKLPKAVKKVLGIASPSKVMMEIGGFVTEGLAEGIEGKLKLAKNAVAKLTEIPTVADFATPAAVISGRVQQSTAGSLDNSTTVNQTINFNEPIQTPSDVARALKKQAMYGLAVD